MLILGAQKRPHEENALNALTDLATIKGRGEFSHLQKLRDEEWTEVEVLFLAGLGAQNVAVLYPLAIVFLDVCSSRKQSQKQRI